SMSFHYSEGIDTPSVGQMFRGSLAILGKVYDYRGGDITIRMNNTPTQTSFIKNRPIGRISAFSDSLNGLDLKTGGGTYNLLTLNTHILIREVTVESSESNNEIQITKRIQMIVTLAPSNEPESHWTSVTESFDKCDVFETN
ncbi:MAG: hypothetical protein NTV34_14630, partial [Proteobacteria bacterium]|nr:hypothetical protein [Pseudomonadota bacterium]